MLHSEDAFGVAMGDLLPIGHADGQTVQKGPRRDMDAYGSIRG
jgi:hypothetical protein